MYTIKTKIVLRADSKTFEWETLDKWNLMIDEALEEIIGALLGSLFVKFVIGNQANLGANTPNYAFPIPVIIGVEVACFCNANDCYFCSCLY